jgi:hypothetical protein
MKNLEKKYSVVAFVDILGYKELIQKNSVEREMAVFNDLKKTIDSALIGSVKLSKFTLKSLGDDSQDNISDRLKVKQFSDNIYFSFDYEDDFDLSFAVFNISVISSVYQKFMLSKGYFVRGGIASGLNMINTNFIFSKALIEAVEIEKNTVFPRITLSQDLKKKIIYAKNDPFKTLVSDLYVEDWSGNSFLNPFNANDRNIRAIEQLSQEDLSKLLAVVENQQSQINKLNKSLPNILNDGDFNTMIRVYINKNITKYRNKNQGIYEKYLWLRNFLNWVENKDSDLIFKYL